MLSELVSNYIELSSTYTLYLHYLSVQIHLVVLYIPLLEAHNVRRPTSHQVDKYVSLVQTSLYHQLHISACILLQLDVPVPFAIRRALYLSTSFNMVLKTHLTPINYQVLFFSMDFFKDHIAAYHHLSPNGSICYVLKCEGNYDLLRLIFHVYDLLLLIFHVLFW